MGWIAYTREGEIIREGPETARPVAAGEEGRLLAIAQEDVGRRIAIDLTMGVIFIDYDEIRIVNGYLEVNGFKSMFYICDETTRLGYLLEEIKSPMDDQGFYTAEYKPYVWRPIWFTRYHNGQPTWVIGAQATIDGRNFKKMLSIFVDGTIGID